MKVLVTVLASLVLAAAGCSGGGGGARRSGGQAEPPRPTAEAATGEGCHRPAAPSRAEGPRVRQLSAIPVDPDAIGSLALWGSRLAYTTADSVVVCDLTSGSLTTIDKAPEGWTVGSVSGDKDTVVWTRFRLLDGPERPWTLHAQDLKHEGARARVIRSEDPKGEFFSSPVPSMEWPYLTWVELPDGGGDVKKAGFDLMSYDFRDGSTRTVAGHTFPDDASTTKGLVYFSAKAAESNTRDLFVVPADGSAPPRAVTTLSRDVVESVRASDGWVSWMLHPKDPTEPIGDRPVMAMPVGRTTGTPFGEAALAYPGASYVVLGGDDLRVRAAGSEPPGIPIGGPGYAVSPMWITDGNRIAFLEVEDYLEARDRAFIRVVEIN